MVTTKTNEANATAKRNILTHIGVTSNFKWPHISMRTKLYNYTIKLILYFTVKRLYIKWDYEIVMLILLSLYHVKITSVEYALMKFHMHSNNIIYIISNNFVNLILKLKLIKMNGRS